MRSHLEIVFKIHILLGEEYGVGKLKSVAVSQKGV
jgi:hypothetical protein